MRQRTLIITLAIIILLFVIYNYMKPADNSGCQPDAQEKANIKNCGCMGVSSTISQARFLTPDIEDLFSPPPPSVSGGATLECSQPVENPCPCTQPNWNPNEDWG